MTNAAKLAATVGLLLVLVGAGAASAAPRGPVADIGVTILAPASTESGGSIDVRYAVTNDGLVDAHDIAVRISRPSGAQNEGCFDPQGAISGCSGEAFLVNLLPASTTASVDVIYDVVADAGSVLTFSDLIEDSSLSDVDENQANNAATATSNVVAPVTTTVQPSDEPTPSPTAPPEPPPAPTVFATTGAAPSDLPHTGRDPVPTIAIAVAMLLNGVVYRALGRRRLR